MKFNESQVRAASNVIHKYATMHGGTGTDIHHRAAVFAVFAIMTGKLRAVPEIYRDLAQDVDIGVQDVELSAADAPTPAPEGLFVERVDYERWRTILEGMTIDSVNTNISISEEAAALLREPEGIFPEVGIYIPYRMAVGMVEQAMQEAADPDTIIGKQVRESIAARPKTDLDALTVAELKTLAEDNNVQLETSMLKADIIARLHEFGF